MLRRKSALIAPLAIAALTACTGAAFAQSGGTPPPGGTPAPPTTTPTPTTPVVPVPTSPFVFPIQGPHTYGDGFGAARGGRGHQGQDVMSPCGTPLVALTAGRIVVNKTHGAAGNMVVLRGRSPAKQDYVYMHLSAPSLLVKGAPVTAGTVLGAVGKTGNASACHLHFELWVTPGYYKGGKPVNPLGALQSWDAIS